MKYKRYISRIDEVLSEYKENIDKLADDLKAKQAGVEAECARNADMWSEKYLEKYKKEQMPTGKFYNSQMKLLRDAAKRKVEYPLKQLTSEIDGFFNAESNKDFVLRVSTVDSMGIDLTDAEFNALHREAKTYYELRFLEKLANKRSQTVNNVVLEQNGASAEPVMKQTEIRTPYKLPPLPDIGEAYKAIDDYSRNIYRLLNQYAGNEGELYEGLEPDDKGNIPDKTIVISSDAYFRNKYGERIESILNEISATIPGQEKASVELSDDENKLLDILLPPDEVRKYGDFIARQTVNETAKKSFIAEDLISRSEYAKYLDI